MIMVSSPFNESVVAVQSPDGAVHFRRVRVDLDGMITLHSGDPQRYPDIMYNSEKMHLIGRMVGAWRRSIK